jgi:hypothetical protein
VSATATDAAAIRRVFGAVLRQHRDLPPAGPVGGFAALTAEQAARLAAAGDCRASAPPA